MVTMLVAGYPAPAVVGLGGAWLADQGYAAGWLWVMAVTCALMLLLVRNLYGLWVVVLTGGAVAALSWTAPGLMLSVSAHVMVWSLLLAAPRTVVELQRQRRRLRHLGRGDSHADQLARLTGVPAVLWIGMFWLVCVVCLVWGGWLVFGGSRPAMGP